MNDAAVRLGYFDEHDLFEKPHGRRVTKITEARFRSWDPAYDEDGRWLEDVLDAEGNPVPVPEPVPHPFSTAPAGGTTRPIKDPPPAASGLGGADAIGFVADLLAILGAAGLIPWGRSIYTWLRRNRQHSVNIGGALPVALWHLQQAFPSAIIDARYDAFDPIVDSGYSANYEAVFMFRFFDRINGNAFVVEIDSRGELRSLSQRPVGPFE